MSTILKKYVLFMISDKPIVPPTNTDGVQHFINEELEIVGDGFFTIEKALPNHMTLKYSNQIMYGESGAISVSIVSWLDCVINCSGYVPFYKIPKKDANSV